MFKLVRLVMRNMKLMVGLLGKIVVTRKDILILG